MPNKAIYQPSVSYGNVFVFLHIPIHMLNAEAYTLNQINLQVNRSSLSQLALKQYFKPWLGQIWTNLTGG